MSSDVVEIAIKGNSSGLVEASKDGDKALDGLGNEAKDAGKKLDGLGKGAQQTGKKVDALGKDAKESERELDGMGREARSVGTDLDGMSRKAEQASKATSHLGRASQSLRTGGKVLAWGSDKVINQYTALAGGAGIGLALKKQMELNDQITQMGIAARDSSGQVDGKSFAGWFGDTKKQVMDVSKATGQGAEELTSGMQAIVQRTGDMKLATDNLKLMGEAATASGSSVEEVGALVANLGQKANISGSEQMRQAITLLLAQGKSGAFELKDMVTNGERLFSVMNLFGKTGVGGLKSFGAFVQMSRMATGSAENAATAIERLGSFMSNVHKVEKQLKGAGIHVKLDEKADMETNIKKIISTTGGRFSDLALKRLSSSQAFGEEGIRAISMLANEYMAGNGFKMFDSFKNAGGDLSHNTMLSDDFLTRVQDSKFQLQRLATTLREFADKSLSAPLAELTKMMSFFNGNATLTDALIRNITKSLLAMAAVAGSVKMYKMFQEFRGLFGGARGAGKTSGTLGQVAEMGVQRVFVVNMGSSGMGGSGSSSVPGTPSEMYGPPRPASAWNRWGRNAAIGSSIVGAGAFMAFTESGNTPEGWGRTLGSAAGVALGAYGGPIGMMIGQQIGDYTGLFFGNTIGQLAKDVEAQQKQKRDADHADITGSAKQAKFKEYMNISDVTSNGPSNLQRAAEQGTKSSTGSRFMSSLSKVSEEDARRILPNISLNVETHVAMDGTSKTRVSGENSDKIPVSTGFFKEASDSLGSLTAPWALGAH